MKITKSEYLSDTLLFVVPNSPGKYLHTEVNGRDPEAGKLIRMEKPWVHRTAAPLKPVPPRTRALPPVS